ncbi:MAG: pyridoxine 5'-phosphate synthase [Planctomycetes bacterium]|nr:pyridoxine 5'-phosphate synthase [Planctomycetota bacterium]
MVHPRRVLRLGVNVDHVATVRQARRIAEPDPVVAAILAQPAGADSNVAHLREDRRHIQDADIRRLKKAVRRLNMEMAIWPGVIETALEVRPERVTLVPERREELTTEGGLDVAGGGPRLARAVRRFRDARILVSMFVGPDADQVRASVALGAAAVEFHTGHYANARTAAGRRADLDRIRAAAALAASLGLEVAAGHGLNLANVSAIVRIPEIEELNIGHSIVGRAILAGMPAAVREMKALMRR